MLMVLSIKTLLDNTTTYAHEISIVNRKARSHLPMFANHLAAADVFLLTMVNHEAPRAGSA